MEEKLSLWLNQVVVVLNSEIYTGKENNEVQRDKGRKAVMSAMQP